MCKKIDYHIDDYKKEKKFHRCLHSFKKFLISTIGILISSILITAIVVILCFTGNTTGIMDFFSFLVIFLAAIFGFDHLQHAQNRIMMEFLEDIKKKWNSTEMLLARKCVLNSKDGDKVFLKEQGEHVDFKLKLSEANEKYFSDADKASAKADVCNFFEELGYFLKRRVIDIDFIDEMYGHVVKGYFTTLKGYMDQEKKSDEKAYSNFYNLQEVLYNISQTCHL